MDFSKGTYILKLEAEIEVFIEQLIGNPDLVICGGGHIALPLCKMGKILDFNTTVIVAGKNLLVKIDLKWQIILYVNLLKRLLIK